MKRRIKRSAESWSPPTIDKEWVSKLDSQLDWWRSIGIQPHIPLLAILAATSGRDQFEEYLEERIAASKVRRAKGTQSLPPLPANRPGEPWLKRYVPVLLKHLRDRKQTQDRSIQAIYDLFKLAGHADVVTEEKIRHIIRTERKRTKR